MTSAPTHMERELGEAPEVVARQRVANRAACEELADRLRARPPKVVVTCARGSSDHAATFGKYLIETRLGVPVASAAPSISSVYGRRLDLDGQLAVVISQSGRSPDLVSFAEDAVAAGATLVTIVNDTTSPLAGLGDVCLPLHAGRERSVAATKSYIASLSALVQIVAAWEDGDELTGPLDRLPDALRAGLGCDWHGAMSGSGATDALRGMTDCIVVGRGLGFGIAQEAALKLKETCGVHAEAISAAELQHGPMAIVRPQYPILVFSQQDETHPGVGAVVGHLREMGATVWVAEAGPPLAGRLEVPPGLHPACAPIAMVQSFYRFVHALARSRGLDPDAPPHLRKVTETV